MYSPSDILHPLNVLGTRNVVPPTPQPPAAHVPASETVYQIDDNNNFRFDPSYNGTATVTYTQGGVQQMLTLPPEDSGNIVTITPDANTDIVLSGDILSANALGHNLRYASWGSTLQYVNLANSLYVIDMRNAGAGISESGASLTMYVNLLYAQANTADQKQICLDIIEYTISAGTIWVNTNDTYATEVIAAAEAKGWMVNEYAQ